MPTEPGQHDHATGGRGEQMTRTRMGKEKKYTDVDFFPLQISQSVKKNNQLHVGMLLFILKGTPQQKGKDVSNP